MDDALRDYIINARNKNLSVEKIRAELIATGWPEEQVNEAITPPKTDDLIPPPPPPIQHVGMWIGFLYIIFFISLYILAIAISGLLHDWIDTAEPIKTATDSYTAGNSSWIRGLIAAVIVSFPIFMTLALVLKKQLIKKTQIRDLQSRKMLIYLTLIGTYILMLSHVIITLYDFLGGTFTGTAIKHLLVTFLIAGGIFWYFLSEVKYDRKST